MSDINIIIKDRIGKTHKITAPANMALNLMEVIRLYKLAPEGTIGTCGGMAMCASCQCYIISEHDLDNIKDDEKAMLSEAFYVQDNSRLSCQIYLNEKLDNLKIEIAPE